MSEELKAVVKACEDADAGATSLFMLTALVCSGVATLATSPSVSTMSAAAIVEYIEAQHKLFLLWKEAAMTGLEVE